MQLPSAPSPSTRTLPRRLEALLALTGKVGCLADVGTDHALLPAHAVLRGVCERAVAVDIREKLLIQARPTLALLGVSDRVTLLQGDGLAALAGTPVDAVVLAGLGGRTLLSWCRAAPDVVQRLQRLVVQPNRQLAELRAWAYGAGLWLVDESICVDHGRLFVSCAFVPASGPDPSYAECGVALEHAFELGPWLVRRRDPEALAHYARERGRVGKMVAGGATERSGQLAAYTAACRLLP